MKFRVDDIDYISVDELKARYCDAVMFIEDMKIHNGELYGIHRFIGPLHEKTFTNRKCSKIDIQENKALQILMTGRIISYEAFLSHIAHGDVENLDVKLAMVVICRLRKILKHVDVEIKTIRGVGYQMTKENIDKVKAYIEIAKPVAAEF